jgi:hypothetical protein
MASSQPSMRAERETPMGRIRIISIEGLIDFKLQGFLNDARRSLKIVTFGGAI